LGTRARVVIASAVAGLLALANPGLAADDTATGGSGATAVVRSADTAGDDGSVDRYWTPARMAGAKHVTASPPPRPLTTTPAEVDGGDEVTIPPVPPAGPTPKATAVSAPYGEYPAKLNGKVFFSDVKGTDYECSGTAVSSDNKSVVWTAGHCVHQGSGGEFHRNWVFVPGYLAGAAPDGRWSARKLLTTDDWAEKGDYRQDFGAAVVRPLGGQRLAERIGGHGMLFNASRDQTWTVFGYPGTGPFDGTRQYMCVSNRLADDYPSGPGPATLKIACDMTAGSSGGGWLVGLSGGYGKVNSVMSYSYDDVGMSYGSYQGDEAFALYNAAKKIKA
jgi:hypothetical protein